MRLIHFFLGSVDAAAFFRVGGAVPMFVPGFCDTDLPKAGMLPSLWNISPLPSMTVVGKTELVS